MSELIEWVRATGLPITLQNTENLNNYAKQAGWKLANVDSGLSADGDKEYFEPGSIEWHEAAIVGMSDKKEIEQYVIDVCKVDINIQGKLTTVQNKAIKAIRGNYDNSETNS